MCGRFTLRSSAHEMQEVFGLLAEPLVRPRYNIAPTQQVSVVRAEGDGRVCVPMRWGLIPSWSKDIKIGASLINARSETVAEKPSFRAAFKRRRCLIPTDGFFEWHTLGPKQKQPYLIGMQDGSLFAFAGIWEQWTSPDASVIESCSVLTTEANALLGRIHDRMPVILNRHAYTPWLTVPETNLAELQPFFVPYPADAMQMFPVSPLVGSPRHDTAACVEPIHLPFNTDTP